MDNLTPKEQRKIEKLAKLVDEGADDQTLVLHEMIEEKTDALEEKIEAISQEVKKKLSELDEELLYEVDEDKIVASVLAKVIIPAPLKGDKGDSIKGDKGDTVTVEKVIEKTEIIRELPIVTENVVEVALDEKPEALRDKLETLKDEDRLDAKAIKNLPEATKEIIKMVGGVGSQPVKAGTNISITYDGNGAPVINARQNLQSVTDFGATTTNAITAQSFIRTGGTALQFLKADGSIDSSTYLTSYTETDTLASVTGRGATTAVQSTFSGGLLSGLGTALLPSYSFSGDTDTGMWSPTADTLAFSEGGVEIMRINSSGNVAIGTTTIGARLQINTGVATTIGQIIRGAVSQTANLLQLQSSAAVNNWFVNPQGNTTIGGGSSMGVHAGIPLFINAGNPDNGITFMRIVDGYGVQRLEIGTNGTYWPDTIINFGNAFGGAGGGEGGFTGANWTSGRGMGFNLGANIAITDYDFGTYAVVNDTGNNNKRAGLVFGARTEDAEREAMGFSIATNESPTVGYASKRFFVNSAGVTTASLSNHGTGTGGSVNIGLDTREQFNITHRNALPYDNALTTQDFTTGLGSELVTNGTFTGDATGWTLGTGWAYNSNDIAKSSDGTGVLSQSISGLVIGSRYRIFITMLSQVGNSNPIGTATIRLTGGVTITCSNKIRGGTTAGRAIEFAFVADATTKTLEITPTNTSRFRLDDISLKQVTKGGAYITGDFRVGAGQALFGYASGANASAKVQVESTTQGFLFPRMTTAQKNAIGTPANGLVIYDTTLAKLCVYTTAWETITSV